LRKENRYFDVFPQVVRAGQETTLTIRPLFDHCRFSNAVYNITLIPTEGVVGKMHAFDVIQRSPSEDGALRIPYRFEGEQEYVILAESATDETQQIEFRVYALADDLFSLRPYKGDMHLHSYKSDGWESPAYVAGACRRTGLDFMAVTDHRRYAPSLEAMRAFEAVPIDLRIYPGEEVHPPDNPVHLINFGGSFSINERFREDEPTYRAEVQAIVETLTDWPSGMDPYPYASCVWCFEKIREAGGLGLFSHPYWFTRHRYDVPEHLTTQLLERQPFDALELIADYHRFEAESNMLQVARYGEERAKGQRIPIVGVSDTHGCERGEMFGWYYTVAFAPSADLQDLIQSIKDCQAVAIEALPGETPRPHGPFRLVKYTRFLLREIFPQHDELCVEEGRLMLAHLAGDPYAVQMLHACQGRVAALYDHLWGVREDRW
jgi:hypothetical protein